MLICCCTPPPPPPSPSPDDDCDFDCALCCLFDPLADLSGYTIECNIDGVTGDNCPCVNGDYTLEYVPLSGQPGTWVYSGTGAGCEPGQDVYIEVNCGLPDASRVARFQFLIPEIGCEMLYFCPVEITDPPDTIQGDWHGSGSTCIFGDENELSCDTSAATFSLTVIPPP